MDNKTKCDVCGKIYDKSMYSLCPECLSEETSSERLSNTICNILYILSIIGLIAFAYAGTFHILGEYYYLPRVAITLFFIIGFYKRKEHKRKVYNTKIRRLIFENIDVKNVENPFEISDILTKYEEKK